MLKVGTLVQVNYPDYAAGFQGELLAQESSRRWIVKLNSSQIKESLLLSLEESDFEAIATFKSAPDWL